MPKLALAQLSMSPDLGENLEKGLNAIFEAAQNGADIIAFPEIQLNPFFPQYENVDPSPYLVTRDSAVVGKFQNAAKKAGIICIPNVYLSENEEGYDASVVIDRSGEVLGVSKMIHITHAPGFYEQSYYKPSREGFQVFETDAGRIGVVICFDRHYPESIRACVLKGADLIIIPTVNMEGEPEEMFEWEIRVPAFQNSVAIAMCNRVGKEGEANYFGGSILVGPKGNILVRADDTEGLFYGDFKLSSIREARANNKYLELYDPSVFVV